jgi:acetyl-CoA carboxylase carboxyl transferase subunit alpha
MLQYATYSVISPEGCASILWKSADKAPQAAEAMGITAERLHSLKLIDNVIPEPLGGAHRNYDQIAENLKQNLLEGLEALDSIPIDKLLDQRYKKLMSFGKYREA